jgi:hypothetical protein
MSVSVPELFRPFLAIGQAARSMVPKCMSASILSPNILSKLLTRIGVIEVPSASIATLPSSDQQRRQSRPSVPLAQVSQTQPPQAMHPHPAPMQPGIQAVDPYAGFAYTVYGGQMHPAARPMQPPTAAPPQTWHTSNTIAPQQTHMVPRPAQPMREEPTWSSTYEQAVTPASTIVGGPAAPGFDYRYREDNADWVGGAGDYYGQPVSHPLNSRHRHLDSDIFQYEPSFENPGSFLEDPNTSNADTSTLPTDPADKSRGRKRSRLPVRQRCLSFDCLLIVG